MRISHKKKLTEARRLLTKEEIKSHTPPFQSINWDRKRANVQKKVAKRITTEKRLKELKKKVR